MRRAPRLKKLPRDICPDKRVTRQIADMKIGLHPLLAVFDEVQNLFAHPKYGKQAGEDAEFIIKVGRALGVILVLATQRPDKDSLPTGVSGNVTIRYCLRVAGQVENDMILGTSAYKNGIRATTFRPGDDAGIGYLAGATATATVVKAAYIDVPQAEAIAKRAHAMRTAAGTITGHAAGEATAAAASPTEQADNVLDDLMAIWPGTENKVWSETLTAALALLRPEVYTGWGPDQLVAVLKPRGIRTVQVGRRIDGKTVNRRGVERDAVLAAIAERDRNRAAG
jgi:S-DNA-T family DNA segregation ATPase FtsK/SpoIIIE